MDADVFKRLLRDLSAEAHELAGQRVEPDTLHAPAAAEFLTYVAQSRPCVVRGVASQWPAAKLWQSDAYLCAKLGTADVRVNVTPTGRADAVTYVEELGRDVFVTPEERHMTFAAFCHLLQDSDDVAYVSAQCGSLRTDFAAVAGDVPEHVEFATACFGSPPDAVNLWCGDARSVTSFHSDPYENVYAVIRGTKTFTLVPPWDVHRLNRRKVPVGRYVSTCNPHGWRVELKDDDTIRWATATPHAAEAGSSLLGDGGPAPMTVTLRAGEMLYLPALWAHHVQQSDGTIAVNWWHDMRFAATYAMHHFLLRLTDNFSDNGAVECK